MFHWDIAAVQQIQLTALTFYQLKTAWFNRLQLGVHTVNDNQSLLILNININLSCMWKSSSPIIQTWKHSSIPGSRVHLFCICVQAKVIRSGQLNEENICKMWSSFVHLLAVKINTNTVCVVLQPNVLVAYFLICFNFIKQTSA